MKIKFPARISFLIALLIAVAAVPARAADEVIDIDKTAGKQLIPVSISGYAGEVDAVLRFDLEVAGCKLVAADAAQYVLTGSNNGVVKGQLIDRVSKVSLLAKAYPSGTPRAQAHALSDDVVQAITGKRGIAQTKIAFKVDTGANSEIYIADYDGHGAQAVTADSTIVAAPTWVPGKLVLLYTSYKLGPPNIFSHDLVSRARGVVAKYPGLNTSPAVSPDGRRVAMILSKNGSPDVYVADLDGTNLKQLTKTREDESSPCWSPDGHSLCFVSRESGRAALYTVPAGGGETRRIQTAGVFSATEPDWSPDGKTIIFTTQHGGASFELCTVPASGGTVTALGVPGEDPSWAPNSRTVIFARRSKNGHRVLSLLDVPTKQVKDVAQVPGSCSQPSWAK